MFESTTTAEAVCFLATGGGSRPCRVTVETGSLRLECGEQTVRWPTAKLVLTTGGEEGDWVFVSCPQAATAVERLAIRNRDLIRELAERAPAEVAALLQAAIDSHRHRHRRGWPGVLLAGCVAALFIGAGWWLLTRTLPEIAAATLPIATERLLGEAALAEMLAGETELEAGPAVDAIRSITARLAAAVDANPGYDFDVHLVQSELVNAAALPGGGIVVFTGLLAEAGSAEEVAGVLAHEMQHVLHRDSLRQLVGHLGGAAILRLLAGGGDFRGLAAQAGQLDRLAYGRDQEAAADRDGLRLLAAAGLPPTAMPDFFQRLQRAEAPGLPEFLATHPETGRRIADLQRLAADLPAAPVRPLEIDWPAVQASLE